MTEAKAKVMRFTEASEALRLAIDKEKKLLAIAENIQKMNEEKGIEGDDEGKTKKQKKRQKKEKKKEEEKKKRKKERNGIIFLVEFVSWTIIDCRCYLCSYCVVLKQCSLTLIYFYNFLASLSVKICIG